MLLSLLCRRSHPELRRRSYVNDADIQWHGEKPLEPDWSETSRLVAYTLNNGKGGGLYVAFNTAHVPLMLELPDPPGGATQSWRVVIDTSRVAPYDVLIPDEELTQQEVEEVGHTDVGQQSCAADAAAAWC